MKEYYLATYKKTDGTYGTALVLSDSETNLSVSLLILFHAGIAYNTWGEANYIFFGEVRPLASIVTL